MYSGYMFPVIDKWYWILVVPTIILSFIAQFAVKGTFKKYSNVRISSNLMGREVAKKVLDAAGVDNVNIEKVSGYLSDHYDPRHQVLRLSDPVYGSSSIAAAAVAAHEAGHAVQKKVKYFPLVLRSTLVPAANIGSMVGPYLAMFGIFLSNQYLLQAGIILFAVSVAFYIVTLPVEINASHRAIKLLREEKLIDNTEIGKARAVLAAAAFTYIAAALTQVASLLRLILIARNRKN